jgi:molecular chaperone DnaK (HSP70)
VNGGQEAIIIRFDETELSVSVVRGNDSSDNSPPGGAMTAGYAREDTGCQALGNWIALDILARHRMVCTGGKGQRIQEIIVTRIDEVFSQLAESGKAALDISDPISGTTISVRISCDDIGRIIEEHGFFTILERCLNRADAAARGGGYEEAFRVAVLMIGRGSSLAPVQDMVRQRLSPVPVRCDRPFEAVARGAALFVPRCSAPENRIRNDYALRYWDPEAREHRYRFLVRNGARYPSAGQVARITISAAYDGQTRLGIPLYEIRGTAAGKEPSIELVSDPAGGVRCAGPAGSAGTGSRPLPVNGRTPVLLVADPPAVKGEPRFELTFLLDRDKQLCLSARDLVTGTLIKRDAPVHRLT